MSRRFTNGQAFGIVWTVTVILTILMIAMMSRGFAFDNGEHKNVSPEIRDWFRGVRSPRGVPCCDIADGHRTDYEMRPDGFYIPVPWMPTGKENWIMIPPEVVIYDAGNPVGEAVVWYIESSQYIRCFV